MVEVGALTELDAAGVLAVAERAQVEMMAAETARFVLAAHWVDLHAGEALEEERRRRGGRVLPGMERSRRAGADGTPRVAEFAAMELGAVLGMGVVAAGCFQRDAVNVRHRHPLLWDLLEQGGVRVWQAREVARRCAAAGLDRDRARWVDARTTPYLCSLSWGRFEGLVEARIVEADPAAAEERARAAALARFVRTGQSSEFGLKTVVARASAGDVVFFVAMVDRLAAVLAERGDGDPVDVRRSKAIGILANPARALLMLQESAAAAAVDDVEEQRAADGDEADAADAEDAGGADDDADSDGAGEGSFDDPAAVPETVGEWDVHPSVNDADDPAPEPCPACAGAGTVTGDATPFLRPRPPGLGGLETVDTRRLLPAATLYIHVSEEAVRTGVGVARMEGVGPITIGQVREFLGHCRVRPVRVVDVAGQVPVDGYEVPARIAEALWLRNPACVAPYSSNLSRRKDADHVRGYVSPDAGGPPGQTSMANLGLLSRFAHRVKTHGRWGLRQPRPGVYEWRSPHGYWFRVDHRGTHPLGRRPDQQHQPAPEQDPGPARTAQLVELLHCPVRLDHADLDTHAA